MNALPLLTRELVVATRRTSTQRLKMAFGGGSMLVAVWSLLVTAAGSGRTIFITLAVIATAMSMFAAIFVASDAVSRERREGTIGFLFLTDLDAVGIVLGKIAAAGLLPTMALIAMFPALAVCQLIGGVTVALFWKTMIALGLGLIYSLSATTFISTLCEDHRKAYSGATLLLLVANPFLLLACAFGWASFSLAVLAFGSLALFFVYASGKGLGRNWRNFYKPLVRKTDAGRDDVPRWLLEKFPVAWMMLRRQKMRKHWTVLGFAVATVATLFLLPVLSINIYATEILWALFAIHLGYEFVLIARTAYAFYGDRQTGALELVLGSRLANEEIFEGFNRFLLRKSALFVSLLTVFDAGIAFLFWKGGVGKMSALPLGLAGGLWITLFGLGWLGVYRSLMMNHPSLAILATFARLALVPTLLSLLFLQVPGTDFVKVAVFYVFASAFLAAFFSTNAKAALAVHGRSLLLRPYTEKPPHIEGEWSFIDWEHADGEERSMISPSEAPARI